MGSSGGGFGNLSLVGDGVLVWDDDVLGTDVSVRSSGFGGELGVGTGSLLSGELSVLASNGVVGGTGTVGTTVSSGVTISASGSANWFTAWGAFEGNGGGRSDKGSKDEFHLN